MKVFLFSQSFNDLDKYNELKTEKEKRKKTCVWCIFKII